MWIQNNRWKFNRTGVQCDTTQYNKYRTIQFNVCISVKHIFKSVSLPIHAQSATNFVLPRLAFVGRRDLEDWAPHKFRLVEYYIKNHYD